MIGSFRQYLVEEEKVVYFSFGRMNPPTIGHGKLLDKLAGAAGRNPYRMYVSQSVDQKKNPLEYKSKVKYIRKMFPKHARSVLLNNKVKNAMEVASSLYDEGFRKVVMVVGSDRLREFDVLLKKYNGKTGGRHGFYNFMDIKVISAGERDPDAEGASGMSASKMRKAAVDKDFTAFAQGLPKSLSNPDSKRLFNDVRKGMGLKEASDFKKHLRLEPVSDIREKYVDGGLFEVGDEVIIKESNKVGTVTTLGSNYVIVQIGEDKERKWLTDIELIDEYKYEWGTDAGRKYMQRVTPGQEGTSNPNIWDNIRKRRAKGEPPKKPGDKGYPKTLDLPEDPCWDTHKQVGTKMKKGKEVPNCVPKNEKTEVSQDPDIKDKEGSQPATFHKGIKTKSTKSKRDAHFAKMAKRKDHKNPDLYKPAPGDATAKTKPSQYTKKFKQMYGEEQKPKSNVDRVKARINRQNKIADKRQDRMMDRARLRDTIIKNRKTT